MPKIETYKFDIERIEKLDKQRHQIVHPKGRTFEASFEDFESDLRFWFSTAEYCHVLVCRRFDYLPKEHMYSQNERLFRIF
ncbi:MAG: hypothetical protein JWL77_2603 [Chthonomonadaceae bacterium]|nr:hypothetical protein [Chthonomonadaceae bacterium]